MAQRKAKRRVKKSQQFSRIILELRTADILEVRPDLEDKLDEDLFDKIADRLEGDFNENFQGRLADNIRELEQDEEDEKQFANPGS